MAEEFERCNKCGGGWFEEKRNVLIQKGSEPNKKPMIYQLQIDYVCKTCGYIPFHYIKE